ALALLAGDGAVRLLRHDRARRAMLIERARPGYDASGLPEKQAVRVAIAAAKKFWRPAERGAPFRWIGDHVPRWLDNAGNHYLVRQAKEIYETMHPSDATLVHGDFHHHNLLSHGEGWVVIDPKPMVGEPEFDVPTFLWNPIGHQPTRESVESWIAAFADAGLDANLLRKWARTGDLPGTAAIAERDGGDLTAAQGGASSPLIVGFWSAAPSTPGRRPLGADSR